MYSISICCSVLIALVVMKSCKLVNSCSFIKKSNSVLSAGIRSDWLRRAKRVLLSSVQEIDRGKDRLVGEIEYLESFFFNKI